MKKILYLSIAVAFLSVVLFSKGASEWSYVCAGISFYLFLFWGVLKVGTWVAMRELEDELLREELEFWDIPDERLVPEEQLTEYEAYRL